ncbi:hypothetical protein LTR53_005737 [Teratosphaeriaceae sp. CCFEE 6253]|nr:hypothetical protein LTR53_005737 [Teratosphaeriaceae sp. CCFEE 6253]
MWASWKPITSSPHSASNTNYYRFRCRTLDAFAYERLADPEGSIRLLSLAPGYGTEQIVCRLLVGCLEDLPCYHAISYTWGDSHDRSQIVVNGRCLQVGRNCEYALQQARHHAMSRYLWIDSVCINQADVEEKTSQVRLMGNIFGRASHVLVCVGAHADDSAFVMSVLGDYDLAVLSLAQSPENPDAERVYGPWNGSTYCSAANQWVVSHGAAQLQRFGEGFRLLLLRSYLERLWILQEVFGRRESATLCCGFDRQSLLCVSLLHDALLKSSRYMYQDDAIASSVSKHWALGRWNTSTPTSATARTSTRERTIDGPAPTQKVFSPLKPLKDVLSDSALFRCHDPRDKVYGVLPLVDWNGRTPLVPDYRKTKVDLALEIVSHERSSSGPELLSLSWMKRLVRTFDIRLHEVDMALCTGRDDRLPARLAAQQCHGARGEEPRAAMSPFRETDASLEWWRGYRVRPPGQSRNHHGTCCDEPPEDSPYGLSNGYGGMSPGDWILTQTPRKLALVVRPGADGRCILTSFMLAAYEQHDFSVEEAGRFQVWIAPEDLLWLATCARFAEDEANSPGDGHPFHQLRVACARRAYSSFAAPWEPERSPTASDEPSTSEMEAGAPIGSAQLHITVAM